MHELQLTAGNSLKALRKEIPRARTDEWVSVGAMVWKHVGVGVSGQWEFLFAAELSHLNGSSTRPCRSWPVE